MAVNYGLAPEFPDGSNPVKSQIRSAIQNAMVTYVDTLSGLTGNDHSGTQYITTGGFNSQGDGGGTDWHSTGNTGTASTKDLANGVVYDSAGNEFGFLRTNEVWAEQFGAIGDGNNSNGSRNDQAFSDADAYCASANATLFIGPGDFRHDATITFSGNYSVVGAGMLATTLRITTDNLSVDNQLQGVMDRLEIRGDQVAGKTTDGMHIDVSGRVEIGYVEVRSHYNGVIYKGANTSPIWHLITRDNANYGFWADAVNSNTNGMYLWIDARANGSDGIVLGEKDTGDTAFQPRQNNGYLSAQNNGGVGIRIRSRSNVFVAYTEANGGGVGLRYEGAGAFGNWVNLTTNEIVDEVSDTSGSPGRNHRSGILGTTDQTGFDYLLVKDLFSIRDFDLTGRMDLYHDSDINFKFDFNGTSGAQLLTFENTAGTDINMNFNGRLQPQECRPLSDNTYDLGGASNRWAEVFAANGTINTSDKREKQDVRALSDAEMRAWSKVSWVAYRWIDAVKNKGEDARTHTGAVAQHVKEAFESEGLDGFEYGLLCEDVLTEEEWEPVTDENGNIKKEVAGYDENGDPIMGDVMDIVDVPILDENGNGKTRMGLRYTECLAFEAAYQRQRVDDLEYRVKQLENK